jgi:hypothetical protein
MMLRGYLEHRASEDETFNEFVRRHETEALKEMFAGAAVSR